MLKCRELAQLASEYLDGSGPKSLKWQIRLHLALCHNCRRFVRHLRTTRELAARVSALEPAPKGQSAKIVQILRSRD
ncbi:zf-HC2 domain-containing protein [Gilvimarinus algae]|uniref:anti-sigma factor family protein n=1 Tax=Gilvimarinus algae TaxID=3058037 RepID=UPI0034A08E4D